jgi:uncharacterized repeat protein (TIGR01451 family)
MTTTRTTHRWRGVVAVTLAAGAVGLLAKRPSLLLLSAATVAVVVYPHLTATPAPSLDIERTVDAETPAPGETVPVTVTLRNGGDATLADVRLVDGVPPVLSVASDSPRHAAVLRPGGSTTFTYAVTAERGRHRFGPATVLVRDVAGAREVETSVSAETTIDCGDPVPTVPLRSRTGVHAGDVRTDRGGSGTEFHRTRSYRRGDPRSRIDWRRFARSGELATVEYREERRASVVLCLDVRAAAYRTSDPEEPHAVAHGVGGAERLFAALSATPNRVGVAALGPTFHWLAPGSGPEHAARGRELFGSTPALSARPPAEGTTPADLDGQVSELRERLDPESQLVVVSPLPDDDVVGACLRLDATGNRVTVLTPDATTGETVGGRFARVERELRIATLRERRVPTVDWATDRPLGTALLEAERRWRG